MLESPARVRLPARFQLLTVIAFGTLAYALMTWRWGGTVEDSLAYFDTARYLRGEIPSSELRAPFPYRLLVPGIASILPGELRHAFASLNWALVTASAVLMWQTVLAVGAGHRRAVLAGLMMLVSVPVYWYAPYLLVDPGSVCARSLFVFAIITGQPWLALFSGLVATAVREENILLLGWLLVSGRVSLRAGIAALAVAVLWLFAVRWWIIGGLPSYTWRPNWWTVRHALQDIPSLLSLAACAGIVLPLGLAGLGGAPARLKPLGWLMVLMVLPSLYAALSVRIDGRAVWGLYPFLIPLAATFAMKRAAPAEVLQ